MKRSSPFSSFTFHYLQHHWGSAIFGTLCSLLLGVIAATIVTLVGPGLLILLKQPLGGGTFPLRELFGNTLGSFVISWSGLVAVEASVVLTYLPWGIVALSATKALLATAQYFTWERCAEKICARIRGELVAGFVYLSPEQRLFGSEKTKESDLSSIFATDLKYLKEYLVHFYGGIPREGFQILFLAVTLICVSPKLFGFFTFGLVPAVYGVRVLGKKLRRRAGEALVNNSELTEWLQRRLLGVETIKHYRTEHLESEKFSAFTESLFRSFLRAARVKARTKPILEFVGIGAMVGVLFLALQAIYSGSLDSAVVITFFASLALLVQAAGELGRYFNSNREGTAAIQRINQLFSYLAARRSESLDRIYGGGEHSIECRSVTVRYPGADKPALQEFSYRFDGGKIYCIFGPSGAGKSTLLNVLLGIKKPTSGEILFHRDLERANGIGYVPQTYELFSNSVAQNIAYPDLIPDADRVAHALAAVGMLDVVEALPGGIHCPVGARGKQLSGGQTQRIMLARLFYHPFRLAVVDEGTSALDPEIEKSIYERILELARRGMTIVMVSHRPLSTRYAHATLSLQGGNLTE